MTKKESLNLTIILFFRLEIREETSKSCDIVCDSQLLFCFLQVKDLEVELETTKEKSKENLQHALSLEKERITKMQWDMEELRR